MRTLYFDCFSGISGDMTVGALIDLGVDPIVIEKELRKLKLESEYSLSWEKVLKNGISAVQFHVNVEYNPNPKDDHHYKKSHGHRHFSHIMEMIKNANFNERVTEISLEIFDKVALSESKIHNIPLEKVHFHEVGAIDSIIDIVATAICIDLLNPDEIISSPVPVGSGTIKIDHGYYPVPAPATLDLLKGIPLKETNIEGELTTPTGAGILATLIDKFQTMPSIKIEQIGYGAGTKTFKNHPNVLRLVIGERVERNET
ncbi:MULTISPECIES: nickel pincer cofactor biosynthesis protein LarC [Mesobacillus]|uniref:LarC family nickel insertion protein n=2 Tax=Mesobacillus TaxID=2675231 RepID=A0A0D6ZBA4_9BACI|nr:MULTISPECIES: nickel pincer cofactor biosynthesis protein LarC [Mesobacillus]KIY23119.1 hypothetical protein UB32_04510 [Mesobacillus subterraneus]MDQ0415292.1 uncharacterized protein (TIGR00299 family) protein [Mesobacillus stamsii]